MSDGIDVTLDHEQRIRGHYGIVGRTTRVVTASNTSTTEEGKILKDSPLIAKIYHPERSRQNEVKTI